MTSCTDCSDELPPARVALGFSVCTLCQEDLEKSGEFSKHKMEIYQSISGWQFEGVETKIIRKSK